MLTALYALLLLAVPLAAWFLLPWVNNKVGRPLSQEPPPIRPFGVFYLYGLRVVAIVTLPLMLFFVWVVSLLGVLEGWLA